MSAHRRDVDPLEKPAGHRRADAWFAAGVVVAVGILAWVVITMQSLAHDLDTSNAARDALARQVQGLGASPVAGPPGSRGDPGPAVVGPSGPPGAPGSPGAAASPAPGPSGPRGPAGSPGPGSTVPGPTGSVGAPGADSTVPGPQGDQGVPGVAGADGKDGVDGRDGAPGQPPASWTWSWTGPDGVVHDYTCSPVDDFDPQAPRYVCTTDAATSPTPTDAPSSSGLLGVGMLAGTAAYRRLWRSAYSTPSGSVARTAVAWLDPTA